MNVSFLRFCSVSDLPYPKGDIDACVMKNCLYAEYSIVVNRCLVVKVEAVIIIIRVIKNVVCATCNTVIEKLQPSEPNFWNYKKKSKTILNDSVNNIPVSSWYFSSFFCVCVCVLAHSVLRHNWCVCVNY